MSEEIKYIKKVKISKLWGHLDIEWDLHSDVNILAGVNGSGKSTILECIMMTIWDSSHKIIRAVDHETNILFNNGLNLYFRSEEKVIIRIPNEKTIREEVLEKLTVDSITASDGVLIPLEIANKLSNNIKTILDLSIETLQKEYLDYQVDIGRKQDEIIEKNHNKSFDYSLEFAKLRSPKQRFLEILDELFHETDKRVDRNENQISFIRFNNVKIKTNQLSAGEKHLLILLLSALTQDREHSICFLDEPELSLNIEWQKKLIGFIRELNPNVQLIIATHSPAMIMDGWMDKVFNVEDLIVKQPK